MCITENQLRRLIREEIINEIQLQKEPKFQEEFDRLLDYIGGMEQAFERAAQNTNDGMKRAILQGMHSDFMQFKSNNWCKFIDMLEK